MVSAQVILKAASGRQLREPVTSKNVQSVIPSSDAIRFATAAFTRAGFEVSPTVANSFSITGPPALFKRFFRTPRQFRAAADATADLELPLTQLPADLSSVIDAVTFTPPPDFGPTNY